MIPQFETLLLISGPVGVGKTCVAGELSTLLQADDIPHTCIDLDALTYTFPRPVSDPFGNALALENLTAVWENCRRRGAKNLILARVAESRDYVEEIAQAIGIADPVVCRLTASDQTLLDRVRTREIGTNLAWHEARSLQLSGLLDEAKVEDFCVSTNDRKVTEIASEIMQRVTWCR